MLRIVGRILLLAVSLLIVLAPAFAQTESAMAATAVTQSHVQLKAPASLPYGCSHAHVGARTESSATLSRVQNLCRLAQVSLNKYRYFSSNAARQAILLPRHKWCRQAPSQSWAAQCYKARQLLRNHARRLAWVRQVVDALVPPAPATNWLTSAFGCIHHYEGAWNANTGNGYYGGLQMDYGFMHSYGAAYLARWGTADNWPPSVQIQVAETAYWSGRGFGPWPNTARDCGFSTASIASQPVRNT